jgi:hypothetical protein
MNLYDEIAKLAYELFEKSGCIPCRELENWLEAERIVLMSHASQEIEEPDETLFIEEVEVVGPVVFAVEGVAGREEKIKPAKKAKRVKKVAAKEKKAAPKKEVKKTVKKTTRKKGE